MERYDDAACSKPNYMHKNRHGSKIATALTNSLLQRHCRGRYTSKTKSRMTCMGCSLLWLIAISSAATRLAVAFQVSPSCNIKRMWRHRRAAFGGTTSSSSLHVLQPLSDFRKWREHRKSGRESRPISPLLQTKDLKKLEEELEDWEEEDFLLADIRPKELNHERDFFRVSTRVQAWDEYVIVSILCTSICYSSLTSSAINPDHVGNFFYETVLRTAIQLSAGAAVLFGIYSTMVFSISILYGKTALGLEQDPQFDSFLDNTVEIRKRAFLSFSYSLGLFALMVVLNLAEILPLTVQIPALVVVVGFLYIFYRDWEVLTAAAEDVFDDE